ncbi:hypothetical protein BGZ88_005090, partial [Linnemannia elongata]
MDFVCYCGSTFTLNSSLKRHYQLCLVAKNTALKEPKKTAQVDISVPRQERAVPLRSSDSSDGISSDGISSSSTSSSSTSSGGSPSASTPSSSTSGGTSCGGVSVPCAPTSMAQVDEPTTGQLLEQKMIERHQVFLETFNEHTTTQHAKFMASMTENHMTFLQAFTTAQVQQSTDLQSALAEQHRKAFEQQLDCIEYLNSPTVIQRPNLLHSLRPIPNLHTPRRRPIVEEIPAPVGETPEPVVEEVDANDMEKKDPEEEDEEEEEEEIIPHVGSSTTKRGTKRKAHTRTVTKRLPPSFPIHPTTITSFYSPSHPTEVTQSPTRTSQRGLTSSEDLLLFSDNILEQIAINANAYATLRGAGSTQGSRKWQDTTVGELYGFNKYYIPSTDVGMIVRFSGRSAHTVKMKCKPTPEGYKIYALSSKGTGSASLPKSG